MEDRTAPPNPADPHLARLSEALATLTESDASTSDSFAVRLPFLLETVARALDVRRVSLWRFDEMRSAIICVDLFDLHSGEHERGAELSRSDFPAYFRALEGQRVIDAADARADPRTREFSATYLEPLGIGAMLDVPLRHGGATAGVLCAEHVGGPRPWTVHDRNFAVSAANVVAAAVAYDERRAALTRLAAAYDERRAALARVADSEARLYSIINTAHDAFIGMDARGTIVEWNAQAVATFGWQRDQAIGAPLAETIIPTGFRDAHLAGMRRFLETGEAPVVNRRLELRALHRDGHEFPVEITITKPLQDREGYFFGAFLRDISERRRGEEELRRARDAAEAATRAKSEFLANMSHELRTPLNGVLGYAQLLLRDPELSASQRDGLETIGRCGSYLLDLINDVLDLSRIEAGRLADMPVPTDLHDLAGDLERVVGPAAGRKGLSLLLDVDPRLPALVLIDQRHLRQVLLNLLGNAIKFTDRGEVRMTMTPDDGRLAVSVSDTGPGIAPEYLEVIFEAFRQTDIGVAAGGSGLGLTISQRLVRAIGGRLSVASTVGAGSTFSFSVPLVVAPADALAAPVARGSEPGPDARLAPGVHLTALVVDDNAVSRQVLASLLESAGIDVITAAGGREGVEHARRFQPDIIFMDRRMPDLDGLDATRRIRADALVSHIPVVAVSASAFTDSPEAARQAGCVDFLPKPVRAEALYAVLQRHLGVAFVSPPSRRDAATHAGVLDLPADAAAIGQRLRAAADLGDVTAVGVIADELRATSAGALARQVADMQRAFDFDGLGRLGDWLAQRPE